MIDVSNHETVFVSGNGECNRKFDVSGVEKVVSNFGNGVVHFEPLDVSEEPTAEEITQAIEETECVVGRSYDSGQNEVES